MTHDAERIHDILGKLYRAHDRALHRVLCSDDAKAQAVLETRRKMERARAGEDAAHACLIAAIESLLMGQIQAALAGYPVSISAPTGIRGLNIGELQALVSEAEDVEDRKILDRLTKGIDRIERGRSWPHPKTIIAAFGLTGPLKTDFEALGVRHDEAIQALSRRHPQLRIVSVYEQPKGRPSIERQNAARNAMAGFMNYLNAA